MARVSRRRFFQTTLAAGVAAALPVRFPIGAMSRRRTDAPRVALTTGTDQVEMTFAGLRMFDREVGLAIGNRPVVIKPNFVSTNNQLAATYADTVEGILEFLRTIGKLDQVVIAESAADGPAPAGYANYGFEPLAQRYRVKLLDLDHLPTELLYVLDETDLRPRSVRVSKMLLDDNAYVISAARMKTHDRVLATLSLKNVVFGAPIKEAPVDGGRPRSHKPIAHGGGLRGINFNLFQLGQRLHPDLAIVDGYEGMEGNGPTNGTAVPHRVCVVSPDWFAADRISLELMGIEFARVPYLNYFSDAGLGEADLRRIEVFGEPVARHKRSYRLHDRVK